MKRSPKRPERRGKTDGGAADGASIKGHRNNSAGGRNRDAREHEEGRTGTSPTTAARNRSHSSTASIQSPSRRPLTVDGDAATVDARESAEGEEAEVAAAAAAAAAARSLSRPVNFGVGAVDITAEGSKGREGARYDEGVGLELPPIEEDQVYCREMEAIRAAGGEVRAHVGFTRDSALFENDNSCRLRESRKLDTVTPWGLVTGNRTSRSLPCEDQVPRVTHMVPCTLTAGLLPERAL